MPEYGKVVLEAYCEIKDMIKIPENYHEYLLAQLDYVYAMGVLEGVLSIETDAEGGK